MNLKEIKLNVQLAVACVLVFAGICLLFMGF